MPKKKIEYRGDDEERNSVYMFHNERYDVHLLLMLMDGIKQ